jgi:hypothetical protein
VASRRAVAILSGASARDTVKPSPGGHLYDNAKAATAAQAPTRIVTRGDVPFVGRFEPFRSWAASTTMVRLVGKVPLNRLVGAIGVTDEDLKAFLDHGVETGPHLWGKPRNPS